MIGALRAFVVKELRHILRDRQTLTVLLLMPLVQVVVFAQARRDDLFQIKSHAPTFCDLRSKRKRSAALRFPILISLVSAHLQIGLAW